MAKGKKEDPNKVAQRKAERVAFVKSRPDLAPDVARKRFYVQTRAQELEAAGKPVDRAALRQKFETGGVTREGFYTPADIARINAKKNTNGQSLAQSKTSTPQPVVPGAPVKPPTTTTSSAPKKTTPQRPPDRIENKVMIAGARQTSPDVMEARKKVSARPMTPITDAQFKAQVDAENAKLYEDLVKKYGGNEKLAQSAYGLMARGSERTSKVEDVLFGRGVSFKTAAKESTGFPQIARGVEGIKSGEGIKGKARGALDIGLGAFTLAGNLLMLKAGGQRLNARFQTKAITPRYELPPARGGVVESLEAGKNFKPTDARQTYYDYPAGPPTPPKSRLDVAADLQKKRAAEVEAAKAPSLHDAKQAELQKMVDETPLNIETPTKTKGKGKAKVDKLINEQGGAVKMGQEYGPARPARASDADILDAMEQADFARMEGVDVVEAPRPNKKKGKGKKVEVKKAEEVADDFEFDASTMEMSSTERATGDAYLYDPKADLSNLADVKVQVKGKSKTKTEPVAEAVTETAKPAGKRKTTSKKKTEPAKPRKTKSDVEIVYPEGSRPQRQTIASRIEIKRPEVGTPMGQAAAKTRPVEGEIANPSSVRPRSQREIRAETERLLSEDPFGTGAPREIRSPQGNLRGESLEQIKRKGGRPKKEDFDLSGMSPRTQAELKAQGDIEIASSSPLRAGREYGEMSAARARKIKRYLVRSKMQGKLSPRGESMLEFIGEEQMWQSRGRQWESAQMSQQELIRITQNPSSNLSRAKSKGSKANIEAEQSLIRIDEERKLANAGTQRQVTPESQQRSVRSNYPILERVEPKIKSGTASIGEMRELLSAYEGLARGSADVTVKKQWKSKASELKKMMGNK